MSPHSQLLIAAATIGGVIVLAFGVMLGGPYELVDDGTGSEPTLVSVTVIDIGGTSDPNSRLQDN